MSLNQPSNCTCADTGSTAAPPLLKLPACGDTGLLLRMELLRRELLPTLLLASVFDAVCTAVSSC